MQDATLPMTPARMGQNGHRRDAGVASGVRGGATQRYLAPAPRPVLSPRFRPWAGTPDGGVAERSKAHAWKVCMRETVSRVRIPPPPPLTGVSGPDTWVTRPYLRHG